MELNWNSCIAMCGFINDVCTYVVSMHHDVSMHHNVSMQPMSTYKRKYMNWSPILYATDL